MEICFRIKVIKPGSVSSLLVLNWKAPEAYLHYQPSSFMLLIYLTWLYYYTFFRDVQSINKNKTKPNFFITYSKKATLSKNFKRLFYYRRDKEITFSIAQTSKHLNLEIPKRLKVKTNYTLPTQPSRAAVWKIKTILTLTPTYFLKTDSLWTW